MVVTTPVDDGLPERVAWISFVGLFGIAAGLALYAVVRLGAGTAADPAPPPVEAPSEPRPRALGLDEGTIGLGNVGTCGCLEGSPGGNGSGYGRGAGGLGPRRPRPATVTPLPPESRGGLDREIVRRVVRRHLPELLACYEPATKIHPELGGFLAIDFTIAPSGQVRAAGVRASTLGHDGIGSCFVEAMRGWRFPSPLYGEDAVVVQRFTMLPPTSPFSPKRRVRRK